MKRNFEGATGPEGKLEVELTTPFPVVNRALSLKQIMRHGYPRQGLPSEVNEWRTRNIKRAPFLRGVRDSMVARRTEFLGLAHIEGTLFGRIIRADGRVLSLGLMGMNIVTSAGVNYIAGCFPNTNEPELLKFHGIGTGATAEVIGDTALGTELTTEYNPNSTRTTGSQSATTNVYTTVGTNTVDAAPGGAIREWGLFSQAAVPGGTMLDRVTFAAVTLAIGDSLQTTFTLTFPAGG